VTSGSRAESVLSTDYGFFVLITVCILTTIGVMIMSIQTKTGNLLSIPEAAKYLSMPEVTLRTYIRRKLIAKTKFVASVAILQEECDRFLRERRTPGRPPQKAKKQSRKKS
jgi:hypothetical protein